MTKAPAADLVQVGEHADARSIGTGALIFLCLGVLWPGWLLAETAPGSDNFHLAYAVQILLLLYVSLRIAMLYVAGRPKWFAVTFWGFTYTWFGLAPMIQLVAGHNPFGQVILPEIATQQALVVLAGVFTYDIGQLLASKVEGTVSVAASRVLVPSRVATLGVVAVLLTPPLVQLSGGVGAMFESRDARALALASGGFYTASSKSIGALITAAAGVLPFMALFCALTLVRQRQQLLANRAATVVMFTLLIGCNVLLNNPISSSRFWVLTVVLSFLFALPAAQSRGGVRMIIAGFVVLGAVVFPYLDAYRYSSTANLTRRSVSYFLINKTDFDTMPQIGEAIRFVTSFGYTNGRQLLGALLFWVPRSWWPEKAIDTGSLLARFTHYGNENLSAPLWGELYIDFGVVGVVLGFALLGAWSAWANRQYVSLLAVGSSSFLIALVPVMAMYQVLILRGSLLQAMGQLAVLIMLWIVLTRREPRPEPEQLALERAELTSEKAR